jgi:LysM repeat protein
MRKFLLTVVASLSLATTFGAPVSAAKATPKHDNKKIVADAAKPQTVAVAPVPVVPQPKQYTVASGDSLSAIADANSLPSWRDLWNANTVISDPNLIYPGQDFVIPTGVTAERPLPVTINAAPLDAASNAYNAQRPVATHAVVTNPNASQGDVFARIRQRESGGNYATNTGNGYYGAYQYDIGTWGNFRGYARADLAPPSVQDEKAAETYARRGCSPWPNTCY